MSVSAIALLRSAYAWSRKLVEFKGPSARVAGEPPERSACAERSTRVAIVFIEPRTPSWINARNINARVMFAALGRLSLQAGHGGDGGISRSGIIQPIRLSEANIAAVARGIVQRCGGQSGIQRG